ncbi:MAG: ABC transporter permease [Roseburia sp.]|nr:ABC transporter permease [Roseburia sp.]MCM1097852.1 ABC transporter permease [Ruminococcus flavefaciens]
MSFLSLVSIEFKKLRRSKILLIFAAAAVILWLPSAVNVELSFGMQAEGISPENSFFIQGFLGVAWFMFPASMVVGTVLLNQTERANHGILKMLALPVDAGKLCLAKFAVLLALAAVQLLMMAGMYYLCAAVCSQTQNYSFWLPLSFVLREIGLLFLSAIPMIAFFWMLSVCIISPIVSVDLGLVSIVPSILMINTKLWFVYPMAYPFFVITAEYGKLAENLDMPRAEPIPWIPAAVLITVVCLSVSCLRFGHSSRNR